MKTLYLGLELPSELHSAVHCPFIRIVPKSKHDPAIMQAFQNFESYTHIIFTSRNAVSIFFDLADRKDLAHKMIISVGQRTNDKLREYGIESDLIAAEETAEGIIAELKKLDLNNAHFFLPQSAIARTVIPDWLLEQQVVHTACPIYDTLPNIPEPLPDLAQFEKIVFTSPSVVQAFIQAYGSLPSGKTLICKGPVTQKFLENSIQSHRLDFRQLHNHTAGLQPIGGS
jgi:uroporphyrinogen-III synthase